MNSKPKEPEVDAESRLRESCALLAAEGVMNAFGHVSWRDGSSFLLSDRSSPLEAATGPIHRLPIDLDDTTPRAPGVPIEAFAHSCVYAARADVRAIARIHGDHANILSIHGAALRPVHYLGTVIGSTAEVFTDPELIIDRARGRQLADGLGQDNALLLRGNGQVVVGSSLEQATVRAAMLEETARFQVEAMQLGTWTAFSAEELAATAPIWNDPVNIQRAWRFLQARHGHPVDQRP
jgi:HCOMODA/2-hydroxy-3-carboxy-muconic semialdehyde decarboxylase